MVVILLDRFIYIQYIENGEGKEKGTEYLSERIHRSINSSKVGFAVSRFT